MGKALLDTGQDSLETIRESRKAAHKYRDNLANFPLFPSIIFQYIPTKEPIQKQAVTHYSQFFPTFAKLTHDSSNDLATLITYANLSGHHITGNL